MESSESEAGTILSRRAQVAQGLKVCLLARVKKTAEYLDSKGFISKRWT